MSKALYRIQVSENVGRALARENLSRRRFAEKVGISTAYASQLLNGTRSPSPDVRQKIQDVLPHMSFDDLFVEIRL